MNQPTQTCVNDHVLSSISDFVEHLSFDFFKFSRANLGLAIEALAFQKTYRNFASFFLEENNANCEILTFFLGTCLFFPDEANIFGH